MRRGRWVGLALIGAIGAGLLGGCATASKETHAAASSPLESLSPSVPPTPGSGIHGSVLAGPTCPVERVDSPCPPRPVTATIEARSIAGQVVGTTTSGSDGTYTFTLPPGSYMLVVTSPAPFPRCPQTSATVAAGALTTASIVCDTGIR